MARLPSQIDEAHPGRPSTHQAMHPTRLLFAGLVALAPTPLVAQSAADLSASIRQAYVEVPEPVVALTNVRVVDGTGAAPRNGQTIVIRDGRIAAVGPAARVDVPGDARTIDLAGHTVIPGIVGLHNHTFYTTSARLVQITESAARLYLASGVTTIRTTGSYHPYSELNLRRAIRSGRQPGPRMYVTGPYITGATTSYMTGLTTPEDARRVVAYWAEEGVDWMKAYTTIGRAELAAAIDEAHARGIKMTGHLCSVSFREAVELGIDNLEHGLFTNSDYAPGKRPDECPSNLRDPLPGLDMSSPEVQATFRDMIEGDVPMTSTLAIYELFVPGRPAELDRRMLDVLAPEVRDEYLKTREQIAMNAEDSNWPVHFSQAQAYELAFVRAGGLLGAGVDPTGIGGALPGFGDQRNYELLIEAGFTPVETIEIMTLNGARILGEEDEFGSIEVGKSADLVVIDGDPIARPVEIRNVVTVFREGVGYDPDALIASVRGAVGIR